MSELTSKAVFLSYAREDADAARHIADALRAFGVEVWFDMSELRGGDAWDQKIRRQIKECALFMPVISSQSEQRGEGYFRLEWKLAAERTHLLADGMPFLFPVVVDDTSETTASVPEQFLKAQWTRLPGGEPTSQFVDQVKRLLSAPRKPAGGAKPAAPVSGSAPVVSAKPGFPLWAAAVLGVAVLALGAFVMFRPAAKPASAPVTSAPAVAVKPAEPITPAIREKSLAVLPFNNMSEEKDSAFFTDGIQEDILTNLALISELHVVSRTSVMQYRNTTKTIRQIAQELGVTYVLEGSVRRAGNKVRVTGQLIRAATDEHVWARSFDRELSDIFAIQEALATEIAGALKTAITPQQKTIIAGRATTSVDAYNSHLKARDIILWSGISRATLPELDRLLHAAVQLDPHFVPAWLDLARVNFRSYRSPTTGGDRNQLLAGQAALAQAIRLAPEDPAVIHAQGLGAEAHEDLAGARKFYERALQLTPGDVEILRSLGELAGQERLWAESMGYLRRAQTLDPRNPIVLWGAYNALLNLRQHDQAAQNARLLVELQPDSLDAAFALASAPFLARGSRQEMEALLARLTPEQHLDPKVVAAKFNWYYHAIGDARAYVELSDRQGIDINFSDADSTMQYAEALCVLGQRDRAAALVRPVLDQLNTKLVANPDDVRLLSSLAYAQALVGDRAATLATLDHMLAQVDRLPLRLQYYVRANAGIVYSWIGEKDKAVDQLAPQLKVPTAATSSVHALRHDIDFSPLRGFPRWEAALADPASSQPFKY
ncbi:MAG: TIR domain-containing protein [Opitutae bacterium]|nr:TIR domain-containing protein [Opitutae bacterium]